MRETSIPVRVVRMLLCHAIHQPAVLTEAEVRSFAETGIQIGLRGEERLPREIAKWGTPKAPLVTTIHKECLREMLIRAATLGGRRSTVETPTQIADAVLASDLHEGHAHA